MTCSLPFDDAYINSGAEMSNAAFSVWKSDKRFQSDFCLFNTDAGLRNIIDKLAEFVARNGPEFENITKHKQQGNPRFSFLYGGDYYQYYQWRVASEQARKSFVIREIQSVNQHSSITSLRQC